MKTQKVIRQGFRSMLLIAVNVQAEVPNLISYQGKRVDSVGDQLPNGNYSLTCMRYDAFEAIDPLCL